MSRFDIDNLNTVESNPRRYENSEERRAYAAGRQDAEVTNRLKTKLRRKDNRYVG